MLALLGHAVGWPLRAAARSRSPMQSPPTCARSAEIGAGQCRSLAELGDAPLVLFDVTPRNCSRWRATLPARYRRGLARFRYGPGVFKLDLASTARSPGAPECRTGRHRPPRRHLRGDRGLRGGAAPRRIATSLCLVAQQSLFDPTRAPAGQHTVWAYCHVPNGSTVDMTERIEAQIERFAPGFREQILARPARGPADLELDNPNYVGGDINGGSLSSQLFTRPVARVARTRLLCRASTSAPPRRRPAAAFTGCAATSRPVRRCVSSRATRTRTDRPRRAAPPRPHVQPSSAAASPRRNQERANGTSDSAIPKRKTPLSAWAKACRTTSCTAGGS